MLHRNRHLPFDLLIPYALGLALPFQWPIAVLMVLFGSFLLHSFVLSLRKHKYSGKPMSSGKPMCSWHSGLFLMVLAFAVGQLKMSRAINLEGRNFVQARIEGKDNGKKNGKKDVVVAGRVVQLFGNQERGVNAQVLLFCGDQGNRPLKVLIRSKETEQKLAPNSFFMAQGHYVKLEVDGQRNVQWNRFLRSKGIVLTFQADRFQLLEADQFGLPRSTKKYLEKLKAIKSRTLDLLTQRMPPKESMNLYKAILFGQKSALNPQTKKKFKRAGAFHLLAISGMHVGILFLLSMGLLKFLTWGKLNRSFVQRLSLVVVWCYVLVVGLSASILRAALMLSIFVHLNQRSLKKVNSNELLTLALLIILVLDPILLLDVGLQLSFGAMIGILNFSPKLMRLLRPKTWILKRIWQIFCITLGAQLITVPLILYYFAEMSLGAYLSGLFTAPLLAPLMLLGLLKIGLGIFGWNPVYLIQLMDACATGFLKILEGISNLDILWFSDVFISSESLICLLASSVLMAFKFPKLKEGILIPILLVSISRGLSLIDLPKKMQMGEIRVKHIPRQSIVQYAKDDKTYLMTSSLSHWTSVHKLAKKLFEEESSSVVLANAETSSNTLPREILWIRNSGTVQNFEEEKRILLLSGSPKVNLDRILKTFRPEQVVSDASNYKHLSSRWRKTCNELEIPFHDTWEKGEFLAVLKEK